MAGLIEVGRACVKLAGRDAGKECLIVEELKDNLVLIDGNTRRRKCNLAHLEFLPQKAEIKKGASHDEVVRAMASAGIRVLERGKKFPKEKKAAKSEEAPEKKRIFSRKKEKKEDAAEQKDN